MFADLAFFSFIELQDPSQRQAYNTWHQLDHRPENLALPGVAWGDRWELPAEYAPLVESNAEFGAVDYVAMYWFRPPVAESVAAWDALGEASFQWGRGPIIPGIRRPMLAFFRPVKGYAAQSALVSPEVLPYRPNRGIHLSVTRFAEPHAGVVHDAHQQADRETMPALLGLDGVSGGWTFSYSHPQQHRTLPLDGSVADAPGSIRIRLLYLEDDPAEVAKRVRDIDEAHETDVAGETLLRAPLKTIIPWQDW
ncbi:hypothetical protein ACFWN7_15540 [Agromyces sp. NPDC058484]|uniref:hypothetical protein n=1 Tax=Agromyces sp. NPDC058484 TaxID=3346524 RepID=UPI003664C2EC